MEVSNARSTPRRRPRRSHGQRLPILVAILGIGIAMSSLAIEDGTPELSDGSVDVETSGVDDGRIRDRLDSLYGSISSLGRIEVAVESGVVRLTGIVPSASAREMAVDLAKKIEGVVAVEDRLEEDRSLAGRMGRALERIASRSMDLLTQLPLFTVALLAAALLLLLGRALASWDAAFHWLSANPFLRDLARQIVRLGFGLVGVLVALEILDATALIGAVIGAAGVLGLAVGFAFRDLVENYIASILLSLRQPFLPDDHIRIGEHEGLVARLTSRATILITRDGNHVRIPNSIVFKGVIENFTRKPERRFSFTVGLGVDEDVVGAQDLGCRILGEMAGVLETPPPQALVDELGDSSVALRFYAWIDQRDSDFRKVRSEAIRLVKQAFDREAIDMPEPIHRIRVAEAAAAPPSPAKETGEVAEVARDVSRETHLEADLREERLEEGEDLLEDDAPQE